MFDQAAIGRGFSIQIFPLGETRWGVVELNVLDSKLSLSGDRIECPGDSRFISSFTRRSIIKMETEAESGEMIMFESFDLLEKWMKNKCNKLWPDCGYCGRRYTANEVVCSGCGGPRGE